MLHGLLKCQDEWFSVSTFYIRCSKVEHVPIRFIILLWHSRCHRYFRYSKTLLWLSSHVFEIWSALSSSLLWSSLENAILLTQRQRELNIWPYLRRLENWQRSGKLQPDVKRGLELFNFSPNFPCPQLLHSYRARVISEFFTKDVHSTFTFEPLHNFHLGTSNLLKRCFVNYLSSGYLAKPGQAVYSKRRSPS